MQVDEKQVSIVNVDKKTAVQSQSCNKREHIVLHLGKMHKKSGSTTYTTMRGLQTSSTEYIVL